MNRTKYKVVSIFLVSTMVVATICSFANAHADDDHTNVSQEQTQKNDALNIVSNSSLTTETQKITNSNSTDYTSTNDAQLQDESTSSSADTIAEKSSSESTEPLPQDRRERMNQSYLAKNSSSNVLIDGTWLNAQQGEVWLNNYDYWLDNNVGGVSYVRLLRYKGTSPNVVIPGIINTRGGIRRVSINNLNANNTTDYLFRDRLQTIESVKFVEGNWNGTNYKVGVHTGNGSALAFRGASNLKNVSLTGLDFSPTNSPDSNSNGYKKTITDTSYMFQNCPKLTSIQFPNMSTNVSNANYMFMNCTSLNNNGLINIEKFFSSSLTTTQGMFYNCKSLTTVPDIVTSNVTNMLDMFSDCSSLNNFDSTKMKNFSTSSATNMQGMFRNSPNVQIFDASNLRVMAATNMNSMFSCSKTASLLIVAPDNSGSSLYNYNDQAIQGNRTPYPFPELNADGGTFEGNVSQKNYFNRCTYYQKDMQMSNINSFLNNNIPTKTGTSFVRWEPSINVNSLLDAARNKLVYKAIWKINPNISPDNQKVNSKGVLGFSYVPTEFDIANAVLNNNEQQSFPFQKIDSLNVGVRDQTNTNTSWRVCAQLKWGSANIPSGAYIQIGKQAKVTQNTNNGSTYNPSINLVSVSNPVGIPSAIITTSSTIIMSNNGTTTLNGVYDLDLGNISLVLPEPQKVSVGSYVATVTWSLVTAP